MHSLDNPQNKKIVQPLPVTALSFLAERDDKGITKLVLLDEKKYQALMVENRYQLRIKETLNYLRKTLALPATAFTRKDGSDIDFLTLDEMYRGLSESPAEQVSTSDLPRSIGDVTLHWVYLLQRYLDELQTDGNPHTPGQKELLQSLLDEHKSLFTDRNLSVEQTKVRLISDAAALREAGLNDLASLAYNARSLNCLFKQMKYDALIARKETGNDIYNAIFYSNLTKELLSKPNSALLSVSEQLALGLKNFINQSFENEKDTDVFISRLQEMLRHDRPAWLSEMADIDEFIQYVVPANDNSKQRELIWRAGYRKKWADLQSMLDTPVTTVKRGLFISYLGEKIYQAKVSVLSEQFREKNYPWLTLAEQHGARLASANRLGMSQMMRHRLKVDLFDRNNKDMLVASFKRQLPGSGKIINSAVDTVTSWGGLLAYFKHDLKLNFEIKNALLNVMLFANYSHGNTFDEILKVLYQREDYAPTGAKLGLPITAKNTASKFKFELSQWPAWYKNTAIENFFSECYQQAWSNLLVYFRRYNTHVLDKKWALVPDESQTIAPADHNNNVTGKVAAIPDLINDLDMTLKKMTTEVDNDPTYQIRLITKTLEYLLYNKISQDNPGAREQAASAMVSLIKNDPQRFAETRNMILAILYGITKKEHAEAILLDQIKNHKATKHLDPKKIWRWALDGNQQNSRGAYGFENEPGYMGGMFNAFTHMLKTVDEKLTANYLRTLHDIAVHDVFVDISAWTNEQSLSKNKKFGNKLSKNFRDIANGFGLRLGVNATQKGIDELIQHNLNLNERLFLIEWANTDKDGQPIRTAAGELVPLENGYIGDVVNTPKLTRDNERCAQKIIDAYHAELIAAAGDRTKKLNAIARLCRDLEAVHLFEDGNARTIGMVLLNKLLLQNDFGPVALNNPNVIDAFSVSELVEEIKKGQQDFKKYIRTFQQSASFSDEEDSGIGDDAESTSCVDSDTESNKNNERRLVDETTKIFSGKEAVWTKTFNPVAIDQAVDGRRLGLCYGLTWMMSLAVSSGDKEHLEKLIDKLASLQSNPYSEEALYLKTALSSLHHYANRTYKDDFLSVYCGSVKTLDEVAAHLKQSTNQLFELNTPNHTMLVGVVGSNETRQFYFCDTNRILAVFNEAEKLSSALHEYFDAGRIARYGLNSAQPLNFEFVPINLEKLQRLKIEVTSDIYLSIKQLSGTTSIADLIDQEKINQSQKNYLVSDTLKNLDRDVHLKLSLSTFESHSMAKSLFDATEDLVLKKQIDADEVPLLTTLKFLDSQQGDYSLQLMNRKDPAKTRLITTRDPRFNNVKTYLDRHLTQFKASSGLADVAAVDGMNSGFAVQQLIRWILDRECQADPDQKNTPSLVLALKLHSYLGLTQMAHATVQDLGHIGQILTALNKAESTLVIGGLHFINGGIGIIFSSGFVALDAWELTHTQSAGQKIVFGTQLGFDSANLLTSVTSISAGLAGSSTAAAFLGYLAVPLGGLTVGATALSAAYGEVINNAEQVGKTFEQINNAYKNKGYSYDSSAQILAPLPYSAISRLNLRDLTFSLGTQFIYAVDDGYIHNDVIDDRQQAISLRDALGYSPLAQALPDAVKQALQNSLAKYIILPNSPSYYLKPYHQYLLGVTSTEVAGRETLRALEARNQRFTFECFHFPYKHILRSMECEFVKTTIDIILAQNSPALLVPEIAHGLYGYITYRIQGAGGEVLLKLNDGVNLELSDQDAEKTTWILDTRLLANDHVRFSEGNLWVAGMKIKTNQADFRMIMQDGTVTRGNYNNNALEVIATDAAQWQQLHHGKIDPYLKDLAKNQPLASRYIAVNHYQVDSENQGLAYYDTQQDKMLFTRLCLPCPEIITLIKQLIAQPLICIEETKKLYWSEKGQFNNADWQPNSTYFQSTYRIYISPETSNKLATLIQDVEKLSNKTKAATLRELVNNLNRNIESVNSSLDKLIERPKRGFTFKHDLVPELVTSLPDNHQRHVRHRWSFLTTKNPVITALRGLQTELDAYAVVFREGVLAGVIDNKAYFYHPEKLLFWQADATSHEFQRQFKPFTNLSSTGQPVRIRSWRESEKLYVTLAYALKTNYPANFIYRIDNDRIELVGIDYDAQDLALLNNLSKHNQIDSGKLKQLFMLEHANNLSALGTVASKATLASLITVTARSQSGIVFRYWITSESYTLGGGERPSLANSSPDSTSALTIIKANLPNTQSSTSSPDLMLVSVFKQNTETARAQSQPDIFYFFCRTQKKLYRQEGPGPAELSNNQKKASLVDIPGLELVIKVSDKHLCATTDEGLVYQVNEAGDYALTGVSSRWLMKHPLDWQRELDRLLLLSSPLAIYGITSKQQDVFAWYIDGGLLILQQAFKNMVHGSIKIEGDDRQQRYAILFDEQNGALYRQALIHQAQPFEFKLSSLSTEKKGAETKLELQVAIPEVQAWFPQIRFHAVQKINNIWQLTSNAGELLSINSAGKFELVGVDSRWLEMRKHLNQRQLCAELHALSAAWLSPYPVLALKQDKQSAPVWYHKKTQQIINTNNLGFHHTDNLQFIGDDQKTLNQLWLYSSTKNKLYRADLNPQTGAVVYREAAVLSGMQRSQEILQMIGTADDDVLTPPYLVDAKKLMLFAGEGKDQYHLQDAWVDYQTVIINNLDNSKQPQRDKINLSVQRLSAIIVTTVGADLLLINSQNRHTLILKNLLGNDTLAYGHFDLTLEQTDKNAPGDGADHTPAQLTIQYEDLVQKLAAFDRVSGLDLVSIFVTRPETSRPTLAANPDL